jgi:hypothetical protein
MCHARCELAHVLLIELGVVPSSSQLVRELARQDGGQLLSCYLPMARKGPGVRQNALRLKHCQRAVTAAAESGAADERTAQTLLRELEQAAEALENPSATRVAGLAMFATPDGCVTLETAAAGAPLVTVGPHFYLVPLLPSALDARELRIVALSAHAVRLFVGWPPREVEAPAGLPRQLTDVVGTEIRPATLQRHGYGSNSIYHGHGDEDDDELPELEAFCRSVSAALASHLDLTTDRVLLAGDVQITAVFRRVAADWPLLAEQIHGNHDRTSAAELATLAEPIVDAWRKAADAQLRELYHMRAADGRASDELTDINSAAHAGRVDTLLLDESRAAATRVRAARAATAVERAGPFNAAAVWTLRCGGTVRLLATGDMPTRKPQAAIYRF